MQRRKLPRDIEIIVDRAFELRNAKKSRAAAALLATIRGRRANHIVVHTLRAILAFEMDEYVTAARSARRALALNPRQRIASEILAHALLDLGKRDAAFREMKRFLSIAESRIFRLYLRDLTRSLKRLDESEQKWLRRWLRQMRPVPMSPKIRIEIGGGERRSPRPSHTTGRADPHPAVRRLR